MTKIKIKPNSAEGEPIWAHLVPLVEFAISKGCSFNGTSAQKPFQATKSGDVCNLRGSVTMEDIEAHFDLPDTFIFGGPHRRCVRDKAQNITLCIFRE